MREQQKGLKQNLPSLPEEITVTPLQEILEKAGISEKTAFVWQKVARVPEDKFEIYFTEAGLKY